MSRRVEDRRTPAAGLRQRSFPLPLAHAAFLAAALVAAPSARAQASATPTMPANLAATPPVPAATFEIRRFSVEGNSVLDSARIAALLAPYSGTARSFADVQDALDALRHAYAHAGFGAVRVTLPEQQVTSGTVRLEVVETRLREIRVEGQTHLDERNILRSLPSLQQGATPNTDELAREIRLANENPAKRISVDLRGASPGELDAWVTVQDERPLKAGAVFDDTGTPATGRTRLGGFLQHANVGGFDHVATLQYVTAPDRPADVTIVALNYRVPLPSLGDSIDVFGVHADVDSGVVGDLFNVRGRGTVAGIRYNQNLTPSASYQPHWLYGIEYRKVDNRVGVAGAAPDLVPDVTLHPASVGYAANWTVRPGSQLDFSATAIHNIPGGAHGGAADINAARAGAKANYSILRYAANLLQTLPADWQFRLAIEGQFSRDALVSGEQFGVGGQDSVRGFYERELANDRGNRATLELQTPNFGERVGAGVAARGLVFIDQGSVRRNHALPGEAVSANISSVGAGLRLSIAPSWRLRVDVAHVTQGAGLHPRGDERLHFSVGYAY